MHLMTDMYEDVAGGLWRATARAAASGLKPAMTAIYKLRGIQTQGVANDDQRPSRKGS